MIRVQWKEPSARHFLCQYLDANHEPAEEIREGDTRQAVVDDFEKDVAAGKIAAVTSVKQYDYAAWQRRAADATTAILKEPGPGETRTFRQQVWADLKVYLIHLFRGKCAYCEVSFIEGSWGDVEHYRPKADVTELDDSPVAGHPGYYWLAYDPGNLMPSCDKCNRALAKMNRFPVAAPARRASRPGDPLKDEQAQFISPYEDAMDARVHFQFETTHGVVPGMIKARTPRAEASIKGYHLNRKPLIDARHRAQVQVVPQITVIVGRAGSLKAEKRAYADGLVPFSAAMLSEFEDWEKRAEVTVPL